MGDQLNRRGYRGLIVLLVIQSLDMLILKYCHRPTPLIVSRIKSIRNTLIASKDTIRYSSNEPGKVSMDKKTTKTSPNDQCKVNKDYHIDSISCASCPSHSLHMPPYRQSSVNITLTRRGIYKKAEAVQEISLCLPPCANAANKPPCHIPQDKGKHHPSQTPSQCEQNHLRLHPLNC